MKFADGSIY
jgi:hypothetical protein